MKINALLTITTMIVLSNTELGAVKLGCWVGLVIETIIFALVLEKKGIQKWTMKK